VQEIFETEEWTRRFVKNYWGWLLATLTGTRGDTATQWSERAPNQWKAMQMHIQRAGEASVSASRWCVLTRPVTGLRILLEQVVLFMFASVGMLHILSKMTQKLQRAREARAARQLTSSGWICMSNGEGYMLALRVQ
jgi:hypothetical protein